MTKVIPKGIFLAVGALMSATGCASQARADADPELIAKGQRLYILCQACHATEAPTGAKIGPHLEGILDRPVADADDFQYSTSLSEQDFVWSREKLDEWLQRPTNLAPQTTMNFIGLADEASRKALIAYLATL